MGERLFWHCGAWRPIPPPAPRKGPYVITDTMDATMNHADGRQYDSKRAYERAVRDAGCEIVGNERIAASEVPMDDPGPDLQRAYEELSYG